MFGRSSMRSADPVTSEDAMMIDIQFFDEVGRWNPRKVIFSASVDEARAKSLKVTLFGGIMRLHARVWAKNYVNTHLSHAAAAATFIANVKSSGVVSRRAFFDLVAGEMLGSASPMQTVRSCSAGNRHTNSVPYFANPRELIHDHVRGIDWENIDANDFSKFTSSHVSNLVALINELAPHPENDELIKKINSFSGRLQEWARAIDDENRGSKILKEIGMPLQKAIDSYSYDSDCLPIISMQDSSVGIEAHEFIEKEYQKHLKEHPGFVCVQYEPIVESGFLEYCKDGDYFFTRASVSVLEKMDREILQTDSRLWKNALDSMSDKQKAAMDKRREQLRKDLPRQLEILRERERRFAPVGTPIPSNFSESEMESVDFLKNTNWSNFGKDRHLSAYDIDKISLIIDMIITKDVDQNLVDSLGELLALVLREIEWAKNYFSNKDEFRYFYNDLKSKIVGPAMEVLKNIALKKDLNPATPQAIKFWLDESDSDSESDDDY